MNINTLLIFLIGWCSGAVCGIILTIAKNNIDQTPRGG